MNNQHKSHPRTPDRQQLGLFLLFKRKHKRDPKREQGRVGRHLAVSGGKTLDDPGSGAALEAVKKGFAGLHQVFVG